MTYKTIHTAYGLARRAAAAAAGTSVLLTHIALDDGNGSEITPTEATTALVNEVFRAAINRIYIDEADPTGTFRAELLVPAAEGGFTVRGFGILDDTGGLYAYGSIPAWYKPAVAEGVTADATLTVLFTETNVSTITVTPPESSVTASQAWVIDYINENGFQPGQRGEFYMQNPLGRWLFCDGRALSRSGYPGLFAAIGTTFGAGDGVTTFNIPDDRGNTSRCVDAGRGVDPGRAFGSEQAGALGSHTHTASATAAGGHAHTATSAGAGQHSHTATLGDSGAHTHNASSSSAGQHSHTAESAGSHSHGFRDYYYPENPNQFNLLTPNHENLPVDYNGNRGSQGTDADNTVALYIDKTTEPAGAHTHSTTAEGEHSHSISVEAAAAHTHAASISTQANHSHDITVQAVADHAHAITVQATGAAETRMRNRATYWCIRY